MRAVNPAKYIGAPRGYPRQAALAPDEPSMPTVRPANYDPGAQLLPDIPAAWKLTEDAYKSTVDQLAALEPIAHLFKDQIASLKQQLARHDARVKYEVDEAEMQVPRIRAVARVTEAIRLAQANGIDWEGALDDFLAAVSGAVRQRSRLSAGQHSRLSARQ
jgi:hypothetical protein